MSMESIEFRALKALAERYERALVLLANMNHSPQAPADLPEDSNVCFRIGYRAAVERMRQAKREADEGAR